MQKYDIHFCLISGQAAPNLLPVLDNEFKPNKAIFLVSNKMKQKAEFLAETFKKKNIKVDILPLSAEFNFGKMEEEIFTFIEQYEEQNIALNVTGGTKLIAIAAQNAFSALGKPIFYLDTDKNRIVFMTKDENDWIADKTLNAKVDLETYLSAYGVSVLKRQNCVSNMEWLELSDGFVKKYEKYENNIPLLNFYASNSQNNAFKAKLENSHKNIKSLDELFNELKYQYDIIDYFNGQLDFRNQNTRTFLNGGWLEEYTFHILSEIKDISDFACNFEVANSNFKTNQSTFCRQNVGNGNEFDIAFIAKNKLHIVECKTQKMGKGSEDILYKLETLKDYGGLMTKKCLVSYFPIEKQSILNRAKELNIEIIQGTELKQLKSKLQNWIGKR